MEVISSVLDWKMSLGRELCPKSHSKLMIELEISAKSPYVPSGTFPSKS